MILMTVNLNELFPVILYFCLIILVIVATILGIKFIITMNKINNILDNVEGKVNQLNGVFNIVDSVSDAVTNISEKIAGFIYDKIGNLVEKKKGKDDNE